MMRRRTFLKLPPIVVGVLASGSSNAAPNSRPRPFPESTVMKAERLRKGDVIGLVDPASATWERADVEYVEESLTAISLRPRRGDHLLARHGYFAGRDEERAADIQAMFEDDEVRAIFAVRGGWGSARILRHLDFTRIGAHPKVLLGFSDLTSLLLATHARTDLVTFHGPNALSQWNPFNVGWLRRVLFDAEPATLKNEPEAGDGLAPREHRVVTMREGVARGPLLGGNLTVLSSVIGSDYLPAFDGAVLFLEDVNEDPYRIDRMLTQLSLAGVFDRIAGFVAGAFTDCVPTGGYGSFTIPDLLQHHLGDRDIPAYRGAMIGHIARQFTLPIGLPVEVDAGAGTLRLLEPAVR